MSYRIPTLFSLCALAALLAPAIRADEGGATEQLELRISSANVEIVIVDRGEVDGLRVGDRVVFAPRSGGAPEGVVTAVNEKSAVITLSDRSILLEPGTKGSVELPASRFAPPTPDKPKTPAEADPTPDQPEGAAGAAAGTESGEPTRWKNPDKDYEPDMPLLASLRPVKPRERRRSLTGRVYMLFDHTNNPSSDTDDSFFRAGTDLLMENPFDKGGALNFNAEVGYLTDINEDKEGDFLLRRLSYSRGGHRFSDTRWEVGRFLQHGIPEFGVVDGGEWAMRGGKGQRLGASFGFMPEPFDDYATGTDLQLAVYYEWIADLREELTLTAGFQKTMHNGDLDRDLLIAKVRYYRPKGWNFTGSFWIDFYFGGDQLKSGVELTQAWASLSKSSHRGGVDFDYRRRAFADILRTEYLPPEPNEIADNVYDRLGVDAWRMLSTKLRVRGHLSAYKDEEDTGGAAELGFGLKNVLGKTSDFNATAFATQGQFTDVYGARFAYGKSLHRGRWDLLYEIANHHQIGFPPDVDDLIQHRLRASASVYWESQWDLTVYGQGLSYDEELSWSVGLTLQRRF
ncbi:MAG: hypothetical protein V3T86_08745 [Planctomycetota bacterium]